MENNLSEICNFFVNYFTIKNITAFSVVVALFFGVKNLKLIRKVNKDREDAILFDVVITNLDAAINEIENVDKKKANDSILWSVTAEQLSAYHNIAIRINNECLKKCYCGKLHSYILRISNILDKIDDYRFFYGVNNYINQNAVNLLRESYENHTNISPNALLCIEQFITLFHGARGDYMSNDSEINKILRPVFPGFKEDIDYSEEEIERLGEPFKKIHRYIKEWGDGVRKLYQERDKP